MPDLDYQFAITIRQLIYMLAWAMTGGFAFGGMMGTLFWAWDRWYTKQRRKIRN